MPKSNNVFMRISTRAASVTGAVVGFFSWLLMVPYIMPGYGAFGMMGYMMGYAYSGFGPLSVILGAVFGAIIGFVIAALYNWALELK